MGVLEHWMFKYLISWRSATVCLSLKLGMPLARSSFHDRREKREKREIEIMKLEAWNVLLEKKPWHYLLLWDDNNDLWSWSHFLWLRSGEIGFMWAGKPGNASWRRAPHVPLRLGSALFKGIPGPIRGGGKATAFWSMSPLLPSHELIR